MRSEYFIAGIGASAGGHESLQKFFSNLPANTGVAYVVLTHLHRNHESALTRILSKFSRIPVKKIEGGEMVQPDHVYVLPENVYCTIKGGRLRLHSRSESQLNTSVDVFLHSLAEDQGERSIAIIFSGMGSDGAQGSVEVHNRGGLVLTEDPNTAKFSSMPMATIMSDHPEEVLPPEILAANFNEILASKKVYQRQ